jgi:hypothetical protein
VSSVARQTLRSPAFAGVELRDAQSLRFNLFGVDKTQPDQVLARLNETFRGEQHDNRYGREAVSSKRESKELEIGADWIRYPKRSRIRDPDRLRREALERSVAAILVLVQGLLKN